MSSPRTAASEPAAGALEPLAWAAARAVAVDVARPPAARAVPLHAALGRTLAAPVLAAVGVPAFDAAAMDGYAVAGDGPWRVVGRVLAGGPAWDAVLAAGSAVEIATGAPVPPGTSRILRYERCVRHGTALHGEPDPGDHIRRAGEDLRPGDELVPAGATVTATVHAAAAQAGVTELLVHPAPRVTVLVTGDEVVLDGVPGPGRVRDALSPLVAGLVTRAGGTLVEVRLIADAFDLLHVAVAGADADVVVVTGSSSAGAADHLRGVLAALSATRHVDGVLCRPGHPQSLAALADGRFVVGLPGNPFAGLVAGLTLLEPLVRRLAGAAPPALATAPVDGPATVYPYGVRLVPARLAEGRARIVPGARPGSLRAAATADVLAVLPPSWTSGTDAALLRLP